jgi:hypothetical protein
MWPQRLQSEAVGGEILASAMTVRQAGTDRAEPAGLKHLKGSQELVEVYRIRWADTSTAQPRERPRKPNDPRQATSRAASSSRRLRSRPQERYWRPAHAAFVQQAP